jgi:hypothetical protein
MFLETDGGLLRTTFNSPEAVPSRRNVVGGIFVREQLVTFGMENVLWLPSKYWSSCTKFFKVYSRHIMEEEVPLDLGLLNRSHIRVDMNTSPLLQ